MAACAMCAQCNATHLHMATELLTYAECGNVLLCGHCSDFVKGKVKGKNKKHPLQSIVDYVTNGDLKVGLNKTQIARWSESPLLASNARVQAVRHLDPSFGSSAVYLVRWLFEGAPHVFGDFEYGKNIRRIAAHTALWEELPTACRRCVDGAEFKFSGAYAEAILFGSAEAMKQEFQDVIERPPVVPGLTFFCTKCRLVSSISFEYDCALRAALFLPPTDPGYYVRLAATHRKKKVEVTTV